MAISLWAGLECTVNRVGGRQFDQLDRTGHSHRSGDIELIASLGIEKLRYPVLWERVARNGDPDWRETDARLGEIRAHEIEPIVGLLHHGSGPCHTNLLDPRFPAKFSQYARDVAERYPWVTHYTPINEPLTTARFSALYGFWYPHMQSDSAFVQAILNECRGVVQAMQQIREVNSEARLIQTEDLGRIYSTQALRYQADFENSRRWLTFDLLCGLVDRRHAMWSYLRWAGSTERELNWFQEFACPPDILGINHYVTSDRFLDHRIESYPERSHGTNGRDIYADVEAVRVDRISDWGPLPRLLETWKRYRLPIAITEAHLGCEEEELRSAWLWEMWNSAREASKSGADIRAVTIWAALGAYDWDSLLRSNLGHYEPGVFDVRHTPPRTTSVAETIREMKETQNGGKPGCAALGWWRQEDRIQYRPTPQEVEVTMDEPALVEY